MHHEPGVTFPRESVTMNVHQKQRSVKFAGHVLGAQKMQDLSKSVSVRPLVRRRRPPESSASGEHPGETTRENIRVCGLDPSLACTGYAYMQAGRLITGHIKTDHLRGPHRLFYLRLMMGRILDLAKPALVVYEGYAFGAKGNNMFHIGELGGVLKTLLWERGIDFLEVPPTVMKSIIALSGRAKKPQVAAALKSRFGLAVTQHDEADAAGLMLLGEMRTGARSLDVKAGKLDRFEAIRQTQIVRGKRQGKTQGH